MSARTVLHVDMDAFFVSVELLRRPDLVGRPVVVGGTGPRGVVAAASYEARRYGVFSAMPSAIARRRCPDAVFLPGDHPRYSAVSARVHEIFHRFTPLVEGIALDEAFLDVTGAVRLFGSGPDIAAQIRSAVRDELGLACSVGVAANKFVAKLASKAAKPRAGAGGVVPGAGVVVVAPGEELAFLHPMPVRSLWGVGPATAERIERMGVRTVGDLAALDEDALVRALGAGAGRHLHRLAHARDDRPVEPDRAAKSIGHEETYPEDLYDRDELRMQIVRLGDAVASRLRAHGLGARTVTLKARFAGFDTVTRSTTSPVPLSTGPAIAAVALAQLSGLDVSRGVRLLGVSASNFGVAAVQLALDGLEATAGADSDGADAARVEDTWHDASAAIDTIRERFGAASIGPAGALRPGAAAVTRPGARPWGPDAPPDRQPGAESPR
jgi:DNA polymerase IV